MIMKRDTIYRYFITLVLTLLLAPVTRGQSIAGDWYGQLDFEGIQLTMNLHLTGEQEDISGTFDVPEQGVNGIPFTRFELNGTDVSFRFDPAGFSFSGITDPAYTAIVGYFEQGPYNEKVRFSRDSSSIPETATEKIRRTYEKEEVYIEMRDGVKLFTSIYSPKNPSGKCPILMFRTPYNAEPGGEQAFNFFTTIYERYTDEEYILVFQDVRGRFMSEGEFVHVRPFIPGKKRKEIDEASDTYDTADWLIKNVKNNNGNIGVTGTSYPGFYATMAILSEHPAIRAVSPQAPVTDWFMGDDWHHNGAFFLIDGFDFNRWFGDPHFGESRRSRGLNFSYGMEDNYRFFMELGPIKNTLHYIPDSIYYWYEIFEHPNYDEWWKATVPLPHLDDIQPAVITVGGWFDAEDLYGTLHTYEAIEEQNEKTHPNYLVMGPWSHGQWGAGSADHLGDIYWGKSTNEAYHELEVDFFNHYLKGENTNSFSEATIFMTGTNEWKNYDAWPPENAKATMLYLSDDGTLGYSKPTANNRFNEYPSDPWKPVPYMEDVHMRRDADYMVADQRFASRRPDVLVYQTGVLEENLVMTGKVSADLYVSTTGTDADFIVKIIDVFPDQVRPPEDADIDVPLGGYQMLVRGEVMRGKYRNSFENPEPFVPGKITRVQFDIPDLAHTFKKGHRLMIQVQSSWFPLVDRNPQRFVNIYECNEEDFQKADIRIYCDREHPSSIMVMTSNK